MCAYIARENQGKVMIQTRKLQNSRSKEPRAKHRQNVLATFSCASNDVKAQKLDVFYNSVRTLSQSFRNGESRGNAQNETRCLAARIDFLGIL